MAFLRPPRYGQKRSIIARRGSRASGGPSWDDPRIRRRRSYRTARRAQPSFYPRSWNDNETRAYTLPLWEVFRRAASKCPSIAIDSELMGGAPCISGTRIPVYMVLNAIEHQGSIDGATKSYPRLSADQIKEALAFSKFVVECPIDD